MKRTRLSLATALLLFALHTSAQNELIQRDLIWINPGVHWSLANGYALFVDMEYRSFVFPQRTHQIIIPTVELHKKLDPNWEVGVGGLHFLAFRPGNPFVETQEVTTEWRTHVEGIYSLGNSAQQWKQRLKAEQRFFLLQDGTRFAFRMRYRLEWRKYFTWKKTELMWRINVEPMWQFAEGLPYGHFDQVRLRTGLRIPIKPIELEIGYLYWFQQSGTASTFLSHHIFPLRIILKP